MAPNPRRVIRLWIPAIALFAAACTGTEPAGPTTSIRATTPPATSPSTAVTEAPPRGVELASVLPDALDGNAVVAEAASGGAWLEAEAGSAASGLDLSLDRVALSATSEELTGTAESAPLAEFALSPDGAVFDQPLVVRAAFESTTLGVAADETPDIVAFLSHDGGPWEALETEITTENGVVIASAAVDRFSRVVFLNGHRFVVRFTAGPAAPSEMWWVSESHVFSASVRSNGVPFVSLPDGWEIVSESTVVDTVVEHQAGMEFSLRCRGVGEGRYRFVLKAPDFGLSYPLWSATLDCKRAIRPVAVPGDMDPATAGSQPFSVVYATCAGSHDAHANLDVAAAEAAVAALGGTLTHVHFEEGKCDSHKAAWARQLADMDADLYITTPGLVGALRGDWGGEKAPADGQTYPEPFDDGSRLFVPVEPGAPDWLTDRRLTAYETWLVIHLAVQHRLGDSTDMGGIDWSQLPFLGPAPLDVGSFEDEFVRQWSMPLANG